MQVMQSCFAIDCVYICISEFGKSVPQSSLPPPPPQFYEVKVTKFSTTTSLVVEAIALVFLNIFFFSTVILNAVAIMTIWKSRFLKEKICSFTVFIQSAMDLLNGALSSATPLFVAVYLQQNFDRFMAILFPVVHRAKVTKERLTKYVISVSSAQTIFLSLTLPYSQIARVIIGINVVLFVAFTVVVHASICVFTLSKKKVDYRAENTAAEERKKGIKFSN